MASSEERMMILRMVEEGKVTPEEGARLLAAMGERQVETSGAVASAVGEPAAGGANGDSTVSGASYSSSYNSNYAADFGDSSLNGRFLRVLVSNSMTGKQKVNINIPLGVVEFGLRFIPPSAKVNAQSIRDAITSGTRGRIVDVLDNEKGDHVEIFIE
jgi:hypothetical protein